MSATTMARASLGSGSRMPLPQPRGPLSAQLFDVLVAGPDALVGPLTAPHHDPDDDVVHDEDLQISLFCLQELHYRGLDGVSDTWEWHPATVAVRRALEDAFEAHLRSRLTDLPSPEPTAASVARTLFELTGRPGGPSLSRYVARDATREQLVETLVHRSIYHLKEADPHTWVIPRLHGRAKAAAVEIQSDEYGGGHVESMHQELFRTTLHGAGLADQYGAYIDHVPAVTLAASTFMSLAGLNRRLRGAITGHLAAFEMTSSIPSRLYSDGLNRLGFLPEVRGYFDEHVEADAVHEQIAGRDLAGGLAEAEPELVPDIMFGAAACVLLDEVAATDHLAAWENGRTSLRTPVPGGVA
ncbi:iron-containing redox enzyme family protein [Sanguibacter sp. A247]|uniref:iron-containing redox enzyme family protein n=1 Tax=unclassified Sanguibacter TaxID=2645534 RepID=UPI003FD872C9